MLFYWDTEGVKSWASSSAVRKSMQANRSRDTAPELALRRELHRRGLRFRVNVPVPGMPRRTIDLAWKGRKIAVFVDGCFWHGCPQHCTMPKTNADFWSTKIALNIERDSETRGRLREHGWVVISCWEHEAVLESADKVQKALSIQADGRGFH